MLLWLGPFLFLLGGGAMVFLVVRRRSKAGHVQVEGLSTDEQDRLAKLLDSDEKDRA